MTKAILWTAFLLAIVYCVVANSFPMAGALLGLLAEGLFMWGCARYARTKGQSTVIGALLGIFNVIGLAIVHWLPNKSKPTTA